MQLSHRIKNWWCVLPKREQHLVGVLGIVVIIAILFWGIARPIVQDTKSARLRLNHEQILFEWVKNKANHIMALRDSSTRLIKKNMPFNQAINIASQQYGLQLIRIQSKDSSYQVWFNPTSFNHFIEFLDFMQREYGIRVEMLDITKTKQPGIVEIKRLQMSSGDLK